MTQDEIIEIANSMAFMASIWIEDDSNEFKDMIDFAKLVAAKEREACAMLCESEWDGDADTYESTQAYNECAAAIRARGEA